MACEVESEMEENPLLLNFIFPPFDIIRPHHVVPAIRSFLIKLENDLVALENNVEPTWPKLVDPLEKIIDRLSVVWRVVNHLNAVKDSPELRSSIEEIQPEKVGFQLRLGQSKPIYETFKEIRQSSIWDTLRDARKRVVEGQIKEAVLNGVSLVGEKRERFNTVEQELEKLSQKFEENILDATKKFEKLITDKNEIEGLPATALAAAAQLSVNKGHEKATAEDGPWVLTLNGPSYHSVMQHVRNRSLREDLYRAYVTRASEGELNNTPNIVGILELRQEKAELLGYKNYAALSMDMKMVTLEKAEDLIEKFRDASWDAATQEIQDLNDFAKSQGAAEAGELAHWDINFWSERLRESRYNISEEELRPFFSLPNIIDGIFKLSKTLFDIQIEPADGLAPVWSNDVRFYCVKSSLGTSIAYFYFDLYIRPEKRGGAWADLVVRRSSVVIHDSITHRLPITHIVCNQSPPVGNKPSLMTISEFLENGKLHYIFWNGCIREMLQLINLDDTINSSRLSSGKKVVAVFHEFGHALQHMLTKQDEGLVSGNRGIEWDAIEILSQYMENWYYQRDILVSIAKHHETGEKLPEDLCTKLLSARTFLAGTLLLRQLRYARIDLELHKNYVPGGAESVYDIDQRIGETTLVIPLLPEDRFFCSFSHIFADQYAAGYYSYQWAEVLAYDAFSAFEEVGLDNELAVKKMGSKFRDTILAVGGGKPPMEVYLDFRGREPSPDAFLRYNGLLPIVAAK